MADPASVFLYCPSVGIWVHPSLHVGGVEEAVVVIEESPWSYSEDDFVEEVVGS